MKMSPIEKFFVNSRRRQRSRIMLARKLIGHIPLADGRRYLEIGCGVGVVARTVASEYGLDVTAIDVDPEQIALAKRDAGSAPHLRFIEGDASDLAFDDGQFDIVLSFMATHHIPKLDRALSEIRRVLRPGGHFVYADIFLPAVVAKLGAVFGHSYSLPSAPELIGTLEDAGFTSLWASRPARAVRGHYEAVYRLDGSAPGATIERDRATADSR